MAVFIPNTSLLQKLVYLIKRTFLKAVSFKQIRSYSSHSKPSKIPLTQEDKSVRKNPAIIWI